MESERVAGPALTVIRRLQGGRGLSKEFDSSWSGRIPSKFTKIVLWKGKHSD